MLKYIIEVYFLRIVSSALIRLQQSPPYTGCLPRNDHLLRRATSRHRTPSHEPPRFYNSHPLTMTQQLKRVPTATRLFYIIEVYFLQKVSSAVIRLQRSPPYTGCLPRNDHLLRRITSVHRTPSHELPLSYNSHPLTMTYCWFSLG